MLSALNVTSLIFGGKSSRRLLNFSDNFERPNRHLVYLFLEMRIHSRDALMNVCAFTNLRTLALMCKYTSVIKNDMGGNADSWEDDVLMAISSHCPLLQSLFLGGKKLFLQCSYLIIVGFCIESY